MQKLHLEPIFDLETCSNQISIGMILYVDAKFCGASYNDLVPPSINAVEQAVKVSVVSYFLMICSTFVLLFDNLSYCPTFLLKFLLLSCFIFILSVIVSPIKVENVTPQNQVPI